jgi:DNA recombination-dependent growth factor C
VATGLFLAPGGDRSLEELDRRRLARRRLASDEIRRLVAEHVSELEYLEFILEARVPVRRDELRIVLEEAADERATSDAGLRQAASTVLRMVELERLRMIERDTDPLGVSG